MNKTDLINQLAERLDGDKKTAQVAVEGFIDLVQREVQRGKSVSISGFGVFEKRARAARTARNPRTGESVKVKKTTVPAFRPGKYFKDIISGTVKLPKATGQPLSARAAAAAAKAAAEAAAEAKAARATKSTPAAKTTATKAAAPAKTTTTRSRAASGTAAAKTGSATAAAPKTTRTRATKATADATPAAPTTTRSRATKATAASSNGTTAAKTTRATKTAAASTTAAKPAARRTRAAAAK